MGFKKKLFLVISATLLLVSMSTVSSCKKIANDSSVEGTIWAGLDSDNDYYVYRFYKNGRLGYTSPSGTYNDSDDTWTQTGSTIQMSFTSGYAIRQGTIVGNQMSGNAWNIAGRRWTWSATKQ